jgi:DNA-binding NarL/FixJ family response regulator
MHRSIVIVDDDRGFRRIASALLTAHGWCVAGEADSAETALDVVRDLAPDVVLVDVQLPGMDGIELAERLAGAPAPPHVVLTSTREARDYGARLTTARARGFIPKQALSGSGVAALVA